VKSAVGDRGEPAGGRNDPRVIAALMRGKRLVVSRPNYLGAGVVDCTCPVLAATHGWIPGWDAELLLRGRLRSLELTDLPNWVRKFRPFPGEPYYIGVCVDPRSRWTLPEDRYGGRSHSHFYDGMAVLLCGPSSRTVSAEEWLVDRLWGDPLMTNIDPGGGGLSRTKWPHSALYCCFGGKDLADRAARNTWLREQSGFQRASREDRELAWRRWPAP